jgi:hypothetical protein
MDNIELTIQEIQEKPKRGRKKKYATAEEARKAKLAQTKASNMKKRNSKKGGKIQPPSSPPPVDERAYDEPTIPPPPPEILTTADARQLMTILEQNPPTSEGFDNYLNLTMRYENLYNAFMEFIEDNFRRMEATLPNTPATQERIRRERQSSQNYLARINQYENAINTRIAMNRGVRGMGIFDYVKGFYDYGRKQIKQQATNVKDLIINPIKATKRIAGEAKDYVKAVAFGATKLPPNARNILHQYGDKPISEIVVCRNPVGSLLTGALNAVSLGAFKKEFSKKPYDALYHLYLWIKVEGTNITLEKNEVITMDIDASIRNGSDSMKVPLPTTSGIVPDGLSLNAMMANTEAMMKQKFLTYSAKDNNCQDFVLAVLKSNGLGDESIYAFVKQDTKSLFANDNFLRKVSNTLTDVGARVNTAIFGAGKVEEKETGITEGLGKIKSPVKEKTMANKWITFVKAYANDKGISYSEALKDPNTKALYKKGGGFWKDFAKGFTSVFDVASVPLSFINPALGTAVGGISKGIKGLAGRGVKKGERRKGQPAGARLAYDDLQGKGMPTNQEAFIADAYDSTQLGANAGKRKSK